MPLNTALSRRTALGSVISLGASAGFAMRPAAALAPAQFRDRLRGPILSVPTVFDARFEVDSSGIRRVIETGLKGGCGAVALTSGNSQYDRLTYDEIKELTRTVIHAVAGRALTIAATGPWWTGQAADYARFAESLGADAVQVMLPPYGNDDTLFEHFRTVAAATRCAIVLHGQVPPALLERLMQIESIVAYKEEYTMLYSVDVFAHYARRLNIFCRRAECALSDVPAVRHAGLLQHVVHLRSRAGAAFLGGRSCR
ncbi:MAG TPA: dihydrodipicolinate synthase family protein [Bryobacteraceae bacterium]|nr:dihydrodipicolinate synthase family protein [Bryobacteraceae bacterium]